MQNQPQIQKKGRSAELIALRNRLLIARYYYWSEVKRRRFDDVLSIIEHQELFISEKRILKVLRDNDTYLRQLFRDVSAYMAIKNKYQSFKWN